MKYAEFKKKLSGRLEMGESDIKSLLSANRKILKKLVNKDDGFSIPSLGFFKKHPIIKQKEYSHYHGYKLITRLRKILRFYPESITEKRIKPGIFAHNDLADLLTQSTGVSPMLSQRFLNETAAVIKEGLQRDSQIFVSGIGLFKITRGSAVDNVKTLKNGDEVISFRADAGLRNNILKANEQALRQLFPASLKAGINDLNRHTAHGKADTRHIISAFHHPVIEIAGSSAGAKQSNPENESGYRPENQNRLNRETFLQENKSLYLQEKSSYFEWVVIAVFLIILAAGIFLLKPAAESVNEFSSQPFEFREITEPAVPEKAVER